MSYIYQASKKAQTKKDIPASRHANGKSACRYEYRTFGRGRLVWACVILVAVVLVAFSNVYSSESETVKTEDCDKARNWYHKGLALNDNSETEASYYQSAIDLCPDYYEAHNKLGEVYKAWGKLELAKKEFKQAAKGLLYADAHNNLGEIYRMQGRYDLAAEEFTEAIKIRPDFFEAQNNLKYVNKRLGKFDRAIDSPPDRIASSTFIMIPGLTLPKGSFLADFRYKYWTQEAALRGGPVGVSDAFGPDRREAVVHELIWGIRYGLTDNLTIGLIPKWFSRKTHVTIPFWGVDAWPRVTGFGDTVFLTKYRLWGQRTTHLSAFHLLSIPTGDENAQGEDDGVVRRIPLGSGEFGFTPGLAFTTVKDPLTIHANLSYVFATGTGRLAGDEFHCDLAIAFPRFYDFLATLELNYRWADSNTRKQLVQTQWGFQPPNPAIPPGPRTQETTITEPGGNTLFFSPGVQVSFGKGFKLDLGIQVPIIEPDDAWTEEMVFHVGLTKYFF
jgi:hypothetical protein